MLRSVLPYHWWLSLLVFSIVACGTTDPVSKWSMHLLEGDIEQSAAMLDNNAAFVEAWIQNTRKEFPQGITSFQRSELNDPTASSDQRITVVQLSDANHTRCIYLHNAENSLQLRDNTYGECPVDIVEQPGK